MVTKEEKKDLEVIFKNFDTNGDGKLDMKEIKDGYAKHFEQDMSNDEIEEIFRKIDIDGNGYIEYTEFVSSAMA